MPDGSTTSRSAKEAPHLASSMGPLLLVSLAMCVGFAILQSFGIMAETAKAEMRLSDTALAVVQGVSAAIALLLFSIPIGIWVDRGTRVRILVIMAVAWTIGTFITATAVTPTILFVGRMLAGIGTTGGLTAALSLAADYCPPQQRGRAMLIPTLGKTLGVAAGFTIAGLLLGAFAADRLPAIFGLSSWRGAQLVLGIASALLILPLLLLREPPRHELEAGPGAPLKVVAGELWARRGWVIPLFVGQTSVVMADAAAGIWASPVLQRSYHLLPSEFAGWLGAIVLASGILGAIIGALAADWGQRTRVRGGLLIGAVAAAALGIPSALFPVMPGISGFAMAIGLLLISGTITGLVASVVLTVWLPNELRGLSIGAFIAIAGLIGFGVAPTLVTIVSSLLGGEHHLDSALAIVGVAVSIISVGGFALAMRRAPTEQPLR